MYSYFLYNIIREDDTMVEFDWYELDNVGIYYASLKDKKNPTVFRYAAGLKDDIDPACLKEALKQTIDLYPNFNVTLHRGLFWYYLEEEKHLPNVREEHNPICFRICNSEDDILYRVSYYKKRINFEVSHVLSDGRGTLEVFKTLVSLYVKIKYHVKKKLVFNDSSILEKSEDSFNKYYNGTNKEKNKPGKIYRYKGKKYKNKGKIIELHLACDKVLTEAHANHATLTAYILAVLVKSILKEMKYKDQNKYVKINLPVDLRNYFHSSSSRNFFGVTYVSYQYRGEIPEISEIIPVITKQMDKNITKSNLSKIVNNLVGFQKNYAVRAIPIVIKNYALRAIDSFNSNYITTTVSNVGKISFDSSIEKYVEEVSVITTPDNFRLTVSSYHNDLVITVSDQYVKNNIIKNFVRELASVDGKMHVVANEV